MLRVDRADAPDAAHCERGRAGPLPTCRRRTSELGAVPEWREQIESCPSLLRGV
jgi:hypothetical protein